MINSDLQVIYAEAMRHHPFGFALYHPCHKNILKPGSCGYFNDRGEWNPITDLANPSSLNELSFVGVDEDLQKGEPQMLHWGPKCSKNVTEHRLKGHTKMYAYPLGKRID